MPSDLARKLAGKPLGPMLIALAATLATLNTLGPGPGITCDEGYRVAKGKQLVTALRQQGLSFFRLSNVERNFGRPADAARRRPGDPPVEPPLGHWILGWTHYLFDPQPDDPAVVSIAAARFAPALSFGLLALLVGLWTARVEGHLAGTVAAAAVVLVPRMFAHAHLAALDMLTALWFVAGVLALAEAARGGRWWHLALAGVVWGLAMLVRLHGVLLLPIAAVWLTWRFGRKAWLPMVAWGVTGLATLLIGWPWLWLAPISHLRAFLASGAGRQAVHVFYAGRVWADRDVPWHYPAVMFVVALPLGLLVLGLLGLWAGHRPERLKPELALVAGAWLFMLAVFSWPGVPVYDGVRLFLMDFPLWAVWVGVGARWLVEHPALPWVSRRLRLLGLALVLVLQGTGLVVYHPCQLSHYSLLVGGLAGAERLGFEVSYWGDAVREPLLHEAAAWSGGGPILLVPQLAPWQAAALTVSSPTLAERGIWLVGWDASHPEQAAACRVAVIYHRRADLPAVGETWGEGPVIAEYAKQGVWLARLIRLTRRPYDNGPPVLAPRDPTGARNRRG
jgi:4-amino-4-deoxy-L-arabinose transferase-like glycosyltransferase